MEKFTKVGLARKYRDKYGMEMPTLKLARIMYKEQYESFKDIEQARQAIRSVEGKNGKCNIKITHETPERPRNPYSLPASDETDFEPYIIKGHKRMAIFSDIHAPYHSRAKTFIRSSS